MSSTSPLAARLAQIFSPRNCILAGSLFFATGGLVTSQARDLKAFLLGRAIQGIGGAGIMTISFILVLELAGKKKRGLFIGLVNAGFTMSVSLGALVAGALLPVTGWVRHLSKGMDVADKSSESVILGSKPPIDNLWNWDLPRYPDVLHFRAGGSWRGFNTDETCQDRLPRRNYPGKPSFFVFLDNAKC
jgi:MFS family permease